jgi:hypothetical protein
MTSSPKKECGVGSALKTAVLQGGAYQLLSLLQTPFGLVFWYIEQRKARLQDRIANKRDDNR